MRSAFFLLILAAFPAPILARQAPEGPSNEKAQKTYKEALDDLHRHQTDQALGTFKKADKQDGGHCAVCEKNMIKYGIELRDWKTAEAAATEMIANARSDRDSAVAHCDLGFIFMQQGVINHKQETFAHAHDELTKALTALGNFPIALFFDGQVLAYLHQDETAKAQFQRYVSLAKPDDPKRQRALRYISDPDLARARMAPAFAVTTLDGQHVSLDDLQGKVVLLDFWASWCVPCREALPHMHELAKKFEGQPLVMLSVSLDSDEQKWKDFIARNGMTWLQYWDGGSTGPISKLFSVTAIPQTFTIDADGVLQDEHIGDASLEGKLKKLVAQARAAQPALESAQ